MDRIVDRGTSTPGDRPRPLPAGSGGQQAFASVTDSFQQGAAASATVDIRKAAGALLTRKTSGKAEVQWTKELSVIGSPLIDRGGRIIACDSYPDKALHAYDPLSGAELWKKKVGGENPHPPVLAPDGSLLVAGDDGCLHSLDPATGNEKWSLKTGGFRSLTVYDDGRASVRVGGELLAIDLKSHAITSRTPLTGNFESEPVMGKDGTVYGGGHDGFLYALEPGTGKEKWKYDTGGMLRNSPTIGPDGTIYAGCIGQTLHAVDPATGKGKWAFPTSHWILPSPVVGPDGTVYIGNSENMLYAIDPVSGQHKWEFYVGGEVRIEPVPADNGLLYVATDRNIVLCLDQETGVKLVQYPADSYIHCPPACDGKGNFYFGCNNGKLYAMNVPSITDRVEIEKAAQDPDGNPVDTTPRLEQEGEYLIVDGVKLRVNKDPARQE